jgi:GntR family transcriptional regulator
MSADIRDSNGLDEMLIRRKPLVSTVKEALFEYIKRNRLEGVLLPSEENLCKVVGVSRTTLRNALAILEMDGVVVRKHGVGTYVSRHALHPRIRLNEAPEFSALIQSFGYKSEIQFISHEIRNDLDEINEKLGRETGDNILVIVKNFLADGIPAIHCIDHVPMDLCKEGVEESYLHVPVFDLLDEKCNQKVSYNIAQIIPMIAQGELAQHLAVKEATPIIMFSEVGFNNDDKALLYSEEYYRPDLIGMSIFRKKV